VPGRVFDAVSAAPLHTLPGQDWRATGRLFGWHQIAADRPPSWHKNALTGRTQGNANAPWWRLPDFAGDDIKTVWEPSRWNWLIPFAQRARNGDAAELERLEYWLRDWIDANPPFLGHNWKCAQETSIRLLHLAMAALILDQDHSPGMTLRNLLRLHLMRIAPTLDYARAQDNNHATSEAAALYVGGLWLQSCGDNQGAHWARIGRTQLARTVARLFALDGSFSQHSVTYHRLALDTLSIAEIWRRRRGDHPFPEILRTRAVAAAEWLQAMVDTSSGDAPNIGANDGADLLQLGADYRDFRPSLQVASVLFRKMRAFGEGPWDAACDWLDVDLPDEIAPVPESQLFDNGGYAVLRADTALAVLRYPRFRFRPSHADPLHVDLWAEGHNLLRDGGTFSYNTDPSTMAYFNGIASHNTVQFDDAEPMPRVGRFLFGDWLETEERGTIRDNRFWVSYQDRAGHRHRRELALSDARLEVIDRIEGFRRAVVRWRLAPGDWSLSGTRVSNGRHAVAVTGSMPLAAKLVTGRESRHYLHQEILPVLEIEVTQAGTLTTEVSWRQ